MPSPFTGMNPYLEQPDLWHEFHEALGGVIISMLAHALPEPYRVRGDVTIYGKDWRTDESSPLGRADAFVASAAGTLSTTASAAMIAAPATVKLPYPDTYSETTIEINDNRRRRVVTAIENMSPSNKDLSDDYKRYSSKRMAYI